MFDPIAKRLASERGIALAVTLVSLVVVLVLGLAVLQNSVSGLRTSGNDRQLKTAVALAEAGAEYTRETIRTQLRAGQTLDQLLSRAANSGTLVDSTTLAGFGGTSATSNGTSNRPVVATRPFGSGNFQVFLTNDLLEGGSPSTSVTKITDSNGRIMVTSFAGPAQSLAVAQAQLALYQNFLPGMNLPALITMPGPDVNFQSFASNARLVYGYPPGQPNGPSCYPTIAVSTNAAKAKVDSIMCTPGNCSSGQYTSCGAFGGTYSCPTNGNGHGNGNGNGNGNGTSAINPSTENFFDTTSVANPYNPYYPPDGDGPHTALLPGNPCLTKVSYLQQLVTSVRNFARSNPAEACYSPTQTCTSPYGTTSSPQVTVVDGDFTMRGNESGAGILLVTGKLTFSGTPTYKGVILVIGAGNFEQNGAGNGTISGGMLIANTNTPYVPPNAPAGHACEASCVLNESCTDAASYGSASCHCYAGVPTYNINGGGNSEFYYSTDAIQHYAAGIMPLDLVSMRLMH